MKSFMIALVQQHSPVRTKGENYRKTVAWAKKAARAGAEMICFPELNITGHAGCPEMVDQAEPVPDGPTVRALCDVSAQLGITISAGIVEDERGIHYNTQFIVSPDGYVGKQRKVHLSGDEYFYFRAGTDLPVFELPIGRVGIAICYDNTFPEVSRCLAVQGMEILLAPHASRFGRWPTSVADRRKRVRGLKDNWRRTHACRSNDNGCYSVVCDAVGRSAMGIRGVEANHAGACMVFDPWGRVAAESRSTDIREEMLVVHLDARIVTERRRRKCFNLQTRRPEVFGVLCEPTA